MLLGPRIVARPLYFAAVDIFSYFYVPHACLAVRLKSLRRLTNSPVNITCDHKVHDFDGIVDPLTFVYCCRCLETRTALYLKA